ncbi:MAG TPA: chloride channel protein, partial [Vicinamibacterales bacterium]
AYVAVGLLSLINFFTNLFFFHRFSIAAASPAAHMLGAFVVVVPVIGGLIIGFMARHGSERIRGHGIPEAIESILINGSRVEPKLAVLKPLSSAISIGSGGPFGAEGPIIMTGGAFGSLVAQFLHLSSAERKTLLVAGAAAGMSATFAAPLASVLLAVELLLFEWKPRSFVPVAMASVTAAAARRYLIGLGPLFPVPAHPLFIGPSGLLGCVIVGLGAGLLSAVMTLAVYAAEDLFQKHMPIHWMWWPALGGLAIGVGGLLFPRALGVGYDTIGALLQGDVARKTLLGILLVKSSIWAIALGSGTSGGVLAPLLMMGGALGGVEGAFLPALGPGFWPLVSMGAIPRRHHAVTLHRHRLRDRADARPQHAAAVDGRRHHRARLHGADAAPLHPHGKGQPPRLSPHARVFSRSAGDPVRPRGRAHQRRRALGDDDARADARVPRRHASSAAAPETLSRRRCGAAAARGGDAQPSRILDSHGARLDADRRRDTVAADCRVS